jgi:hypothetical protein
MTGKILLHFIVWKKIIVLDFKIVKGSKIFDDNEKYQSRIAQKACLEKPVKNVC